MKIFENRFRALNRISSITYIIDYKADVTLGQKFRSKISNSACVGVNK